MSTTEQKALYADRNPRKLEPHYTAHVMAMTREDLYSKSDIAAELAWRDQQIEALRAQVEALTIENQALWNDRGTLQNQRDAFLEAGLRARYLLVRDRDAVDEAHTGTDGEIDADGARAVAEFNAVIARIDSAVEGEKKVHPTPSPLTRPAVPETEVHEPKCPALDGGDCICTRNDKHDQAVDRSWARFCAKFGDGPDAPYPGMISAFERYYSQSFADKEWRTESAVWAAAWKAAMLAAAPQPEVQALKPLEPEFAKFVSENVFDLLGQPEAAQPYQLVPIEPTPALLRPFHSCPPDELPEAWQAMIEVARVSARRSAEAQPIDLAVIREWTEGFEARLQHVWKDVIGFIPNVKLWDLQRVLAEFGFTMTVTEVRPGRCTSCDDTGHVHDQTGEWRGLCSCEAGQAIKNQKGGA